MNSSQGDTRTDTQSTAATPTSLSDLSSNTTSITTASSSNEEPTISQNPPFQHAQDRFNTYLTQYSTAPHGMKTTLSAIETPALYPYSLSVSLRQSPALRELWQEIAQHPDGRLASSPDEAQLLALLASTMNAKKIVEVGGFLGSTALALAESIQNNGLLSAEEKKQAEIYVIDINQAYFNTAAKYWRKAKVDQIIKPTLEVATVALKHLIEEKKLNGQVDMVYIDANKNEYKEYYELALQLVRRGGIICIDNVFRFGKVLQDATDPDTEVIKQLNQFLHTDQRVEIAMIPIADGLTICRKV
jgi:predicted O-methyltransferase YrrM